MAAIFGFKEGCKKANPVILEPMMAVEWKRRKTTLATVMGDLSSRRGMVQGMDDMVGGGKAIKAEVPLSEMFGYATAALVHDARSRHLHDGVQALRGSTAQRVRSHHGCARESNCLWLGCKLAAQRGAW